MRRGINWLNIIQGVPEKMFLLEKGNNFFWDHWYMNKSFLCQISRIVNFTLDSLRFLEVPNIPTLGTSLSDASSKLRNDINNFFMGVVDSGFFPSILKVC